VLMLLTEGQRSDHVGGALLLPHLPHATVLLADRGYDSNRFRAGLAERRIAACIPPMPGRRAQLGYDKVLYRQRHKVEIMFGRLKDWRRIAMRYDRCAHTFFSAICIAATFTFWLR
jgi:transposase